MELAVAPQDQDILLKDKNVINESVLNKYRLAGQVSQTTLTYLTKLINDSYHLGKGPKVSSDELAILGDSFLASSLETVYNKGSNHVNEKGISQPVTIDVNNVSNGFGPELDDEHKNFKYFEAGDIVTISLGCHVDGYTSNLSHTLVIYPQGEQTQEGSDELRPTGPLLGPKADAVIAAHIASETVIALLGISLTPEKFPTFLKTLNNGSNAITGSLIRSIVDEVAESFKCIVVPGSRVRRIRRFLAGQAEGVVAEKEYKGVVWSEADQEASLLQKAADNASKDLVKLDKDVKGTGVNQLSAIPSDDFVVNPGEVYLVDIKMAPISEFNEVGLVTLHNVDGYTGKNHDDQSLNIKPSIFVRDFAIHHTLKLRTSRQTLTKIDQTRSVYPFKLSHLSDSFPINLRNISSFGSKELTEDIESIKKDIRSARLGLSEIVNNHLAVAKPVQIAKFLPLHIILKAANSTGSHGYDAENPTLPGLELPLPRLGVSSLKLKSLLKKNSVPIPVAREQSTVVLIQSGISSGGRPEVLRLTGGSKTSKPSWVHSNYQLNETRILVQGAIELIKLSQDKRFGINIRECQPMKLTNILSFDGSLNDTEQMNID
ncbi:putative metalloprotease ARX1 [Wickerhamomyces ciferrii]|uniref:Probable metalloprotease ARX1 n=1 Tax=Wickerhamomyces ciferrii (strain ATCC 14091 / BCRC 22168 / CBS 111 / JCM 3599 / NBRC 0793 / NRRL Y-1031 F-60-10) TaxID=1206466 RepID=K0KST6_WICCF|nr:putative metalloprotease ARX1 [Wickerhamomyces ciferrii]CCH44393.1 putative metalloprotease ARX1 [Wickerhamomyces ciferrii]